MTGELPASLAELRTVGEGLVSKAGSPAAALRRLLDGSVEFAYLPDYAGPAVASTLPVGAPAIVSSNGGLPPFFTNLLPEGRRLTAIRRVLKTSADDDLTMLLAVGGDLVGDVQVTPQGSAPVAAAEIAEPVSDFGDVSFTRVLEDTLGPAGVAASGLPGVQDKASSAMITLPMGSDYILKLTPPEYPHLVENEGFFLDAARRCGLPAAESRVVRDRDGRPGLQVLRFDRLEGRRLAVADGCQALDVHPVRKYDLPAAEVVAALASLCQARPVAIRALFAQIGFAYLTGNGDAHAKNFSAVQDPTGEWRITVAYDLPSTYPYGDTTMALSVGGRTTGWTRARMLEFAAEIGLSRRAAATTLDHLVSSADDWLSRLDELPFDRRRLHDLRRFLQNRQREMAR